MKAVPIQSSDDPRSLKKVDKVYVSNKLKRHMQGIVFICSILHAAKAKRANTRLQTGVSVLTPVCMAIVT